MATMHVRRKTIRKKREGCEVDAKKVILNSLATPRGSSGQYKVPTTRKVQRLTCRHRERVEGGSCPPALISRRPARALDGVRDAESACEAPGGGQGRPRLRRVERQEIDLHTGGRVYGLFGAHDIDDDDDNDDDEGLQR